MKRREPPKKRSNVTKGEEETGEKRGKGEKEIPSGTGIKPKRKGTEMREEEEKEWKREKRKRRK